MTKASQVCGAGTPQAAGTPELIPANMFTVITVHNGYNYILADPPSSKSVNVASVEKA